MRIFSGLAHQAGKAGARFLLALRQKPYTRITQKQSESFGFQDTLCDSVRINVQIKTSIDILQNGGFVNSISDISHLIFYCRKIED